MALKLNHLMAVNKAFIEIPTKQFEKGSLLRCEICVSPKSNYTTMRISQKWRRMKIVQTA